MDIYLNLELQEPINFYGLTIRLPSIAEILRYGLEKYNRLLLPYIISLDSIGTDIPEEQKKHIEIFDIITSDEEMVDLLEESIRFLCNAENVLLTIDESDTVGIWVDYIYENHEKTLDIGHLFINRSNFDDFANIILLINSKERYVAERIPEFENERQKDVWDKLQEGRKRGSRSNSIGLRDIVNFCEFGGNSHIPASEIKTWTLWKLTNAYNSIIGKSSYDDNFQIYLVNGEKELIENKHWSDLIKIK